MARRRPQPRNFQRVGIVDEVIMPILFVIAAASIVLQIGEGILQWLF